jgi:hypothetical protein
MEHVENIDVARSTLGQAVLVAVELKKALADPTYIRSIHDLEELWRLVDALILIVNDLPAPTSDTTLIERIASAQAERLVGKCLTFEHFCDEAGMKHGPLTSERDTSEFDFRAGVFASDVGQFIVFARGL